MSNDLFQLILIWLTASVVFAPITILLLAYRNEDVTVKKVGGITHVKAWSLRLSFSFVKAPLTQAQKREKAMAKREREIIRDSWVKRGYEAWSRKVILRNRTIENRIDRQIAAIDWQADDWTLTDQPARH